MSATAATARPFMPMPQVARLGFHDGWLLLNPCFLNLGLPVLLIDHRILEGADRLGLEPFGSRNPRQPLPAANVRAEINGGGISLWSTWNSQPVLLAAHWFHSSPAALPESQRLGRLILITGDSYAVQLSWSALWTCRIGIATAPQLPPTTNS